MRVWAYHCAGWRFRRRSCRTRLCARPAAVMSKSFAVAIDGLSVSVISDGTHHSVKITPDDGHTFSVCRPSALPAVGNYVIVEYDTACPIAEPEPNSGPPSSPGSDGSSGTAYGLVVSHVSDTEFKMLWSYNANEFNRGQQTRLFGRRRTPEFCRALTTDCVTLVNEDVQELPSGAVPPGQTKMVVTFPTVAVSELPAKELQLLVKTVEWYRAASDEPVATKRKRFNVFDGPGHVAQFAEAYTVGNATRRTHMEAAATTLYGTPDVSSTPYYLAIDHLVFWCAQLRAAALIGD